MVKHPFYIVDVFAEKKYAGNQLAVISNAADIPAEIMQQIGRETNFSETTFILSDRMRDGGYDVRIFTTEEELPFAGHPTLGTAYVIMNCLAGGRPGSLKLNLKVGQIPVTLDDDGILWMKQINPVFGRTFRPEDVAGAIGLTPDDVDDRFPVQEVSTGLPFVIVPLRSNGSLRRARRTTEPFEQFGRRIFMFNAEPRETGHDLAARMFSTEESMHEDPATGSASGCLAGYLVKHRYFGKDIVDVSMEQGYEMGRSSLLRLRAKPVGDEIEVRVGGRAVLVARGELV
jgi:trans-2,3-dihydro-3-hydroxyanthranilate isomerase